MLEELDVNGSGAATLESFCRIQKYKSTVETHGVIRRTFSHFLQTMTN